MAEPRQVAALDPEEVNPALWVGLLEADPDADDRGTTTKNPRMPLRSAAHRCDKRHHRPFCRGDSFAKCCPVSSSVLFRGPAERTPGNLAGPRRVETHRAVQSEPRALRRRRPSV